MPMPLICRTLTTFASDGSLDEQAFGAHLERLISHGHGVYLASGGSGESHAMTVEELKRVYEVGVECCNGRVPVFANPPEQHTVDAAYDHAVLATAAGVEMVNLYGPSNLHGYVPTDDEYIAYHREFLDRFTKPVALAPNPIIGYTPRASLVAQICNEYGQVQAINLALQTETYMADILDALKGPVDFYVPLVGSQSMLAMGAIGMLGAEANIVPRTYRRYATLCEAGVSAELGATFRELRRLTRYLSDWGASPRWLKMALRVLSLPGGKGRPRRPYLLPPQAQLDNFAEGLSHLGVSEMDEMLRGHVEGVASTEINNIEN
jgi:4-hydroxy-tetrahydrodipicolinate synthase